MSSLDSESSSNSSSRYPIDGTYSKMVESGQIGLRLAEEIRILREELLNVKHDKRMLLVSNENLEGALSSANKSLTDMHVRLIDIQSRATCTGEELAKKVGGISVKHARVGRALIII